MKPIPCFVLMTLLGSAAAIPPPVPMLIQTAPASTNGTFAFAVTLSGQYSTNLTDWTFAGSTTFTQQLWNVPAVFWRGLVTISNYWPTSPSAAVLTWHNDNTRAGANTNEIILSPLNVNTNSFGKLWQRALLGHVYAQPLYLNGRVFMVTERNVVYCFSAADGSTVWTNQLENPAPATFHGDVGIDDMIGITGTPVIDSGWIYLDAFSVDSTWHFHHKIHALNLTNGQERSDSALEVSAASAGSGDGSTNGLVQFDARQQLQRPALTMANGSLYLAYGSFADAAPYHGWVLRYNPNPLQLLSVFCTTPNGSDGAIWQSGNGLVVDGFGNLYFETGNGTFDASKQNYGDSVIELSPSLIPLDYFAPSNQLWLEVNDGDLGSAGCVLAGTNLLACGKEGWLYVLGSHLGNYSTNTNNVVTQFWISRAPAAQGMWGSAAWFNGRLYAQGCYDIMRSYDLAGQVLAEATNSYCAYPGSTPSVSANGTNNAIVWTIQSDDYYLAGTGTQNTNAVATLHAWEAYSLRELWNSDLTTNDYAGGPIKFSVPTVANGRVYVAGQNYLAAYGLK